MAGRPSILPLLGIAAGCGWGSGDVFQEPGKREWITTPGRAHKSQSYRVMNSGEVHVLYVSSHYVPQCIETILDMLNQRW